MKSQTAEAVLKTLTEKLSLYGKIVQSKPAVHWAAECGSKSFSIHLLPSLWGPKISKMCPYENPLYREAWMRGFYSCASWTLLTLHTHIMAQHMPLLKQYIALDPSLMKKTPMSQEFRNHFI